MALVKRCTLAIMILFLVVPIALAGPNAGGVLWVHDTGVTVTTDPITWPADPVNCPGDVDVTAPVYPVAADAVPRYWKVYAAFPPGSSPRLKLAGWGTRFTDNVASAYSYVSVVGGDRPNGETSITMFFIGLNGFPTASGGIIGQSFPPGARTTLVTPLFMFWGFGYNGDASANPTWSLVEKAGDDDFGDDLIPTTRDKIAGYGTLGFGQAGSVPCPTNDPLGACCTTIPGGTDSSAVCVLTTQADCASPGVWHGTEYVCEPNPCPVPTGACCTTWGGCLLRTRAECDWGRGVYMGHGVACEPNPCPVGGSCCVPDGSCYLILQTACATHTPPGVWTSGGVCSPNPCPQPRTGACCASSGTCAVTTQAGCTSPAMWHDDWETCTPNPCPQPPIGACCVSDGDCTVTTQALCFSPKIWHAEWATCTPNPCPQPACPTVNTGLPLTLLLSAVYLDGMPVQPGDLLCVTDAGQDSLPVGAATLGGSYPLLVKVWQGDPGFGLPGAACGNAIGYRLHVNATGASHTDAVAVYTAGDGLFCGEPYTRVTLRFGSPPPTGNCCDAATGTCSVVTEAACTTAGFTWLGATACSVQTNCPVPPPSLGACCFRNAFCRILPQSRCLALRGTFYGGICNPATPGCYVPGSKSGLPLDDSAPVEKNSWGQIKNHYR